MVKPNKRGDKNFDNRLPITSYNSVYEVTLPSVTSPKFFVCHNFSYPRNVRLNVISKISWEEIQFNKEE
jgi:hypothetical protein